MLLPEDFLLLEEWTSLTPGQTEQLAGRIFREYLASFPLSVLLLEGEMGAGKTTLVHGFADDLGIQAIINSPTFNLMNHYRGRKGELFHYDLYRLSSSQDVEELGFADSWTTEPEEGTGPFLHVIEWWSKAGDLFPLGVPTFLISLKFDEAEQEGPRRIHVYRTK